MKILVICQHYYPEPFRITDICEELVKRGHEVTVITGIPNYPKGKVYPTYEKGKKSDECLNGVNVHRCDIHPRKRGIIHRLWNYYSFPHKASRYVKKLDNSYDIVFINQLSPVMMAKPGIRYAKKNGKKIILYCLDLWPASLNVGGIKHGVIYKWFYNESKRIYRSVDKILVTSKLFSKYFETEFDINGTEYLPQYAENVFSPERCRKEQNGYIDLMFAGNIGKAQSVDTILKAAELCVDIKNLRWHIVGDGTELEAMKKLSAKLKLENVIFYGSRPLNEMPELYKQADAMLISLINDPVLSCTLPGKVQSYFAAGKPIIGAIGGETANLINETNCGFCSLPENAQGLSQNIRSFCKIYNTDKYIDIVNRVEQFYYSNFSKKIFFEKLDKILEGI